MVDADTIAAIATAPGTGGVGVVRVSGPAVSSVVQAVVGRELAPRVATYVCFKDEAGDPIDEGLALFFSAPRSYTGEDVLEIQAHGGPVVLRRLLERCLAVGARLAHPGEFTKRAYLSGKLDLAQAEAVADLIAARTEQAARSAARSLTGEFSRRIDRFQNELTNLRVLIEGSIDFPEEGIDFLREARVSERLKELLESLEEAIRAGVAGKIQQEGVCVVLLGAPNAGKSSIINELCSDEVAIVTPIPGTTRDLVRATIQLGGVPVEIVDTAGLREAGDVIEEIGIGRTWRAVREADVAVVVLDASRPDDLDSNMIDKIPEGVPRIVVHNKIDLVGIAASHVATEGRNEVWMSALSGAGIEYLRSAILEGTVVNVESPYAARSRHLDALGRCRDSLAMAMDVLGAVELAAEDLRRAQDALSEIVGGVASDELLGEIFSNFCIGK